MIRLMLLIVFCISASISWSQEKSSAPYSKHLIQDINKTFPYNIPLVNLEGDTLLSSEILQNEGRPIAIAFWLTTCPPCRMEMSNIKDHYQEIVSETGVRLLFVSTDFGKNEHKIREIIETNEYPFEVYHDVHREFREVMSGGLNGLPQTFILNSSGEILYHKRKYIPGDEFKLFEAMRKAVHQSN